MKRTVVTALTAIGFMLAGWAADGADWLNGTLINPGHKFVVVWKTDQDRIEAKALLEAGAPTSKVLRYIACLPAVGTTAHIVSAGWGIHKILVTGWHICWLQGHRRNPILPEEQVSTKGGELP